MRRVYTDSLIELVDTELDYINLHSVIYPLSLLPSHIGQPANLIDYSALSTAGVFKANLVFNTNPDQPDTAISTGVLTINGGLYEEEISSESDIDFYDFTLSAGESVQILFRHDFVQNLTHNIYDSAGNALFTESFSRSSFNYSVLEFAATTAGTYYVSTQGVNSSDTGGYQVAILQDQYADNDTTQGVINFDGEVLSGFYNSENDEDWLSFTLGADETAYFRRVEELENPNVFFRVVDSNGNEIDAIGHSEGRDSYTISPGEAGTYFLIITGTSLYSEYNFTAERSAGDVAGDTTTQGELIINGPAVNSAISYLGDDDWFRFEAVAGVEYEFEISGIERANVTVYNEMGDGEASHISPGYLTYIPELSGTYYLSVSTNSSSGDLSPYQITSRTITDDFGQTLEDSGTIIINGPTINGAINFRQDVDWLTFEATAGEIIRFDSSVIDPDFLHYLYIYDLDENPIITGSTRSESGRASATFEVETSGTYVLVIETTLNDNTGSYSITGVTLEDRIGDSFETAQTILADGAVFESRFETLDDTDMFSFTLDEFAAVNLSVDFSNRNPDDLNDFLAANWVIYDEAGNQISENTNLLVAEAGTYFVALTNQTPDIASYGFSVDRIIDDYAGDVSTHGNIEIDGEAIRGNIDYEGDVDWISFTAEAGDNFYLTINSIGQVLEHPEIAIYDSSGELVIEFFSYNRFDLNYFLTVNVTGQYFIQIGAEEFSTTPSGEYILYLETGGDGENDGGPESDVINGTSSGEVIAGYGGDDTLNGNGGDDTVLGGHGDDILDGGAGNDDIRAGSGDDVMTGGLGADNFYFSGLAGANRVTDFTVGEDMLILSIDSPYTSMSNLRDMMVQDGNDILMSYGAGTIRLENVTLSELSLDSFRFATDHPDGPGPFIDPGRSYADIKQEEWDAANAAQPEKDEAPLVAEVMDDDFETSPVETIMLGLGDTSRSVEDFELRFDRILNEPCEELPEWGEWV